MGDAEASSLAAPGDAQVLLTGDGRILVAGLSGDLAALLLRIAPQDPWLLSLQRPDEELLK